MNFTSKELFQIIRLIECEIKVLRDRIRKSKMEELKEEYRKQLREKEKLRSKTFYNFQNALVEENGWEGSEWNVKSAMD